MDLFIFFRPGRRVVFHPPWQFHPGKAWQPEFIAELAQKGQRRS
jgi:hypothetical protein